MRVTRKAEPQIVVAMNLSEAGEFVHMLRMHATGLDEGKFGKGSSIDEQVALIDEFILKMTPMIERFREELTIK